MATPFLSSSQTPTRRSKPLKIVGFSLLSLALVLAISAAIGGYWFYSTAKAALPQLDGTIQAVGLSAPVTVLRDPQGMPHITAANIDDMLFAQGYVTAQDRLWQMDMNRRFGRGELAEILGPSLVKLDKRHRILRITETAEKLVSTLSQSEREHLDAYVKGVNTLIDHQRGHLPIEFRLLRYTPRPWTVEDSVIVGINISESLSTTFPTEHSRESVAAKLGPELASDLYPLTSWRDRPPSALPRDQQFTIPPDEIPPPGTDESVLHSQNIFGADLCDSCFAGSNNWVISADHTTTGKPLLSNDMHLDHSIPNVWYEVHLQAGDYDVAGVSFPGFPFVIVGHNRRIAWGMTNVMPDVQDLFIENFNDSGEYQTPTGWQKPEHHPETIKVKGEPDVPLDVLVTRHGPIVSELFPGETRKLALQWTIYDPQALDFHFYELGLANNWQEFRAAVSHFGGATQNAVYADVDGNIGYQTAGFIPIRKSGDGALPVPGNDDSHDWIGYIPFEKLPSVYNPPTGILATANGRITPDGYPYSLATEWGAPYRTERIYRMLESSKKFSPADMLALQMDDYSEFDRLCADKFVYAVDHARNATSAAKQAADLMRGWDGHTKIDSVATTLSVLSRRNLWEMMLQPKLGAQWKDYAWFNSSTALEKILMNRPQRWLPAGYSDFDDLLAAAVNAAVTDKTNLRTGGSDMSKWQWGKFSRVDIQHPIFGQVTLLNSIPRLRELVGPGNLPQAGDGSLTVKAAGKTFGASERMTVNFADLDSSTLNIVAGESGQVLSEHYLDQWPEWYDGTTFILPFSTKNVNAAAVHRLTLQP